MYRKLLISVVGCELVGIISAPITVSAIPTWYESLNKPFFSPPNWVFGPVWTALYGLMGVATYLVWKQGTKEKKVRKALTLFLVQLFVNFIWSFLFFGLRSPLLGLVDILILDVLLVLAIQRFYAVSKTASYLLLPYIAWVFFATLLNAAIVYLN